MAVPPRDRCLMHAASQLQRAEASEHPDWMHARALVARGWLDLAKQTTDAHDDDEQMRSAPPTCDDLCALGPNADHPGSRGYRCIDKYGTTLPFPGEEQSA